MWLVNLALAFLPSLTLWVICSWALAHFVFRKESRRPELIGRASWKAVETALVAGVFFGCVAIWFGLAMLLDFVIK